MYWSVMSPAIVPCWAAATAAVPATRLRTATTASGARLLKRRIGLPLADGSAPAPKGAEPGAAAVIGRSSGAEERFSGRWTRAPHPTAGRQRRSDRDIVVVAGDRDAVLRAFELVLERPEILVGLELRITLGDREQPPQRRGERGVGLRHLL